MNDFYYRHLSATAERKSRGRNGNYDVALFESKRQFRKLRVILEDGLIGAKKSDELKKRLRVLLNSNLVEVWSITLPIQHVDEAPKGNSDPGPEVLEVFETTGKGGRFAPFGDTYEYFYQQRSEVEECLTRGNIVVAEPTEWLLQNGIESPDQEQLKQAKAAIALMELANAVGADLVISTFDRNHTRLGGIISNTNFVSVDEAVACIAHFLRMQGEFIVGDSPEKRVDSDFYYQYAVYAYAPHLRHWEGKTNRAIEFNGGSLAIHAFYADTALSRCSRALRRFDDLLVYLGKPVTNTDIDDAIDALEHICVALCAAIDALARSISLALEPEEQRVPPKLHNKEWVKKNLGPVYKEVPEFPRLKATRKRVETLFQVRNSIHSLGLMPYFETQDEVKRLEVVFPPTSSNVWERMSREEAEYWQLEVSGNTAKADLFTFAKKCLQTAFEFIDVFCEIISFEQIENKSIVLFENIRGVDDAEGWSIAKYIGQTGFLYSPLLDGSYSPARKRKLESDEESQKMQAAERVLRALGWTPNKDWKPLRQPPLLTIYYR